MCKIYPSEEDFNILCTCAVRYAIGRRTYMPSLVIQAIVPQLQYLEDRTLVVMARDIQEAHTLGDDIIDKPLWWAFLHRVQIELNRRKKGNGKAD